MSPLEAVLPTLTGEAALDWLDEFMPDRIMVQMDVDPDDEHGHCLWTGSTTLLGYVRVYDGERLKMIARWILENTVGPPPTDKHQAGHVCHDLQMGACPATLTEFCFHRLCCNPSHLAWMTASENVQASSRTRAHQISRGLVLPPEQFRSRKVEREMLAALDAREIYADL
jgi:hypothetical protein